MPHGGTTYAVGLLRCPACTHRQDTHHGSTGVCDRCSTASPCPLVAEFAANRAKCPLCPHAIGDHSATGVCPLCSSRARCSVHPTDRGAA